MSDEKVRPIDRCPGKPPSRFNPWNPGVLQRSPKSAEPPPTNKKSPRRGGRIR